MTNDPIVIVGGGMAAAFLVRAMLQHSPLSQEIVVISKELQPCYNRILLSSLLAQEAVLSDLPLLEGVDEVTFKCGAAVVSIHKQARYLTLESGEIVPWSKLIFATGANPVVPAVEETLPSGISAFRSLDDVSYFEQATRPGMSAVVVGGGLLGLEAAYGLAKRDVNVTVVHRNDWLMNRQLDRAGGEVLKQALAAKGIAFELSAEVAHWLHQDGALSGVTLNNGRQMDCELLIYAAGITPNTSLARDTGCRVARGVVVDEHMRTDLDDVFALGECTEFDGVTFGLIEPIQAQADVLAGTLLGVQDKKFTLSDYPTKLKVSGIDIYQTGTVDDAGEQITLDASQAGIYRRLVVHNDRLTGAMLVGDRTGASWYNELIENKTNISKFRKSLMFGPAANAPVSLAGDPRESTHG